MRLHPPTLVELGLTVALGGAALLGISVTPGCAASPEPAAVPAPATPGTAPVDLAAVADRMPPAWRDARSAAMRVATMVPVEDPRTRAEIRLQAALARAAAGDAGGRVAVVLGTVPGDMTMAPGELVLRTMAELYEQDRIWVTAAAAPIVVQIRIDSRARDIAEVEATLRRTRSDRTVRWPVLAAWDGRDWIVDAAGPIAEW